MTLLYALSACIWIPPAEQRTRLDDDRDGYPLREDCDDTREAVQRLDTLAAVELACNTLSVQQVEPEDTAAGRVDLAVLPCPRPDRPERLVELEPDQRLYALKVDAPTAVDVSVGGTFTPSRYLPANYALVGMRGPNCSDAACVVGLPMSGPVIEPTALESSLSTVLQAEETLYILVAGLAEPFDLRITCDGG